MDETESGESTVVKAYGIGQNTVGEPREGGRERFLLESTASTPFKVLNYGTLDQYNV